MDVSETRDFSSNLERKKKIYSVVICIENVNKFELRKIYFLIFFFICIKRRQKCAPDQSTKCSFIRIVH